jgi:carbonyl reductase 1
LLAFGVCRWWSKDTVAVVTGANQGIGYEIARQLAQNGLTVVGTARSEERGKAAVEALRKELGTEAHDLVAFHPLDVTSEQSVAALAQWLHQTYGRVDILVNNAGISRGETDADVFDTNYYGVKRVTTAILPLLRPSSAGARIINVSSSLGELKVHAASQPHM